MMDPLEETNALNTTAETAPTTPHHSRAVMRNGGEIPRRILMRRCRIRRAIAQHGYAGAVRLNVGLFMPSDIR